MKNLPLTISVVIFLSSLSMSIVANAESSLKSEQLRKYAECAVEYSSDSVSSSILEPITFQKRNQAYDNIYIASCIEKLSGFDPFENFNSEAVRYEVARVLVKTHFDDTKLADLSTIPPLTHGTPQDDNPATEMKDKDVNQNMVELIAQSSFAYDSKYGECVVRTDPVGARALLMAAKEQETEQLKNVMPALTSCASRKRDLVVSQIIGLIAVNYYRLATLAAAEKTNA